MFYLETIKILTGNIDVSLLPKPPRAGTFVSLIREGVRDRAGPSLSLVSAAHSAGPGHTYFQTENFSRYLQMIVFSQFSGGEQRQRAAWLAHCPTPSPPPEMHA